MKRNALFCGLMAAALAASLGLSGCVTSNRPSTKPPAFDNRPIDLAGGRRYEILGPVQIEKKWYGIAGLSIGAKKPLDIYVFQTGGITYADLFMAARDLYPDADAVVDINIDHTTTHYWAFYSSRINVATAIAIKFVKAPQASDIKSLELKIN